MKAPVPTESLPKILQCWQNLDLRLPKATIQKLTYLSIGGLRAKEPLYTLQDTQETSIAELVYSKGLSYPSKDVLLDFFSRPLYSSEKKITHFTFKGTETEVSNPAAVLDALKNSDVKEYFTTEIRSLIPITRLSYKLLTSLEVAKIPGKQTDVYLKVFSDENVEDNVVLVAADYITDYFGKFGIQQADHRDWDKIFRDMDKISTTIEAKDKDKAYVVV